MRMWKLPQIIESVNYASSVRRFVDFSVCHNFIIRTRSYINETQFIRYLSYLFVILIYLFQIYLGLHDRSKRKKTEGFVIHFINMIIPHNNDQNSISIFCRIIVKNMAKYIHPEYKRNNYDNDASLIKLKKRINFARYPNIRPVN